MTHRHHHPRHSRHHKSHSHGHASRHHHVHKSHHHHHAHKHHHRHHGKSELHKAWDYAIDRPIHAIWDDVVRPVVALPSEALQTVDKTVGIFENPWPLAGGLAVVSIVLLKK